MWGARKCLLIFVEKKIYFVYLLYQMGSLGESGSIFFFKSAVKKNVTDLHIFVCTIVSVSVCVF